MPLHQSETPFGKNNCVKSPPPQSKKQKQTKNNKKTIQSKKLIHKNKPVQTKILTFFLN